MPKRELELIDYLRLARRLSSRVEPEAVMAVVHVEKGKNDAFYPDGFPTILFERHKFYKHADRQHRDEWHREFPTICNPTPTPQGGYGSHADQRTKFNTAFRLDPDAAMMACSWGCFQELGENYDDYGFENVGAFVDRMKSGIDGQCEIFIASVRHRGLVDELERHDWAGFALHYNGKGYHRFQYDVQIDSAYKIARSKRIDWEAVDQNALPAFSSDEIDRLTNSIGGASTAPSDPAGSNTLSDPASLAVDLGAGGDTGLPAASTSDQAEPPAGSAPLGDAPDEPPSNWFDVLDLKPVCMRWLKRIWGGNLTTNAGQAFANLVGAVKDPEHWYVYAAIAVGVLILLVVLALIVSAPFVVVWLMSHKEIGVKKLEQMRIMADPQKKNVGLNIVRV